MNAFRIERVNGAFAIVCYERKWFRMKRQVLYGDIERLQQAEEILVHKVTDEFAKELDRRRFVAVSATIADCEPRAEEEHIYTALALQGLRPPENFEVISLTIFDKYQEAIGKLVSYTEQRLFLQRYITWFSRHDPEYVDPRLQPSDPYTRNFVSAGLPPPPSNMRTLLNKLTGRSTP